MNAQIVYQNGVPKIEINGEIISSVSFRSFWPRPDITRKFAEGGIRLMSIYPSGILCSLGVPYSQFGEFWLGNGVYDWDVVRAQVNQFLENAPNDYFSLILQLDTRDWFLKEHPECPNSFYHIPEACCCEAWRETAKRCIRDILEFFDREYPEKLYAVYVCAGGTCEWYNSDYMGYHPLKEAAFREWTGDPNRRLPSDAETEKGQYGLLLGEENQNVMDYWRFLTDKVCETILEYAHAVKTYNQGILVGCFTGYSCVFGLQQNTCCHNGMVKRLFDSPDIQIIFSPASYRLRGLEDVSNSQLAMASARLHGKVYYHEIDNTTYVSNNNIYAQVLQQFAHRRHGSLKESIHYARREAACTFAELGTYWWFDMFGGWYDNAELKDALLDIGRAQERLYSKPIASNAQIAYMLDERSSAHQAKRSVLHDQAEPQLRELGRIGAQVDVYAAEDLLDSRFHREQYKLYVFPDLTDPSPEMRKAIEELRTSGASILFLYAPGIFRDGKFDPSAMRELTGLNLMQSDAPFGYTVAKNGEFNTDGMERVFGGKLQEIGIFVEAQESEENAHGYGMLTKKQQFVVKKRENGGFDAWIAQGIVPDFVLRPLAKAAGVFLWQEDGLPVYTNSRMFTIFAHEAGKHTIHTPWQSGKLVDMYTGETHVVTSEPIELSFERDECKSFIYLQEGEEE